MSTLHYILVRKFPRTIFAQAKLYLIYVFLIPTDTHFDSSSRYLGLFDVKMKPSPMDSDVLVFGESYPLIIDVFSHCL